MASPHWLTFILGLIVGWLGSTLTKEWLFDMTLKKNVHNMTKGGNITPSQSKSV